MTSGIRVVETADLPSTVTLFGVTVTAATGVAGDPPASPEIVARVDGTQAGPAPDATLLRSPPWLPRLPAAIFQPIPDSQSLAPTHRILRPLTP